MKKEQEKILAALSAADTEYQRLLCECAALEADYARIMDSLPDCDREILERYIALCEEMDHRRICIALEINKAALL